MIQVTHKEVVEQWRRGGYAAPWSGPFKVGHCGSGSQSGAVKNE